MRKGTAESFAPLHLAKNFLNTSLCFLRLTFKHREEICQGTFWRAAVDDVTNVLGETDAAKLFGEIELAIAPCTWQSISRQQSSGAVP